MATENASNDREAVVVAGDGELQTASEVERDQPLVGARGKDCYTNGGSTRLAATEARPRQHKVVTYSPRRGRVSGREKALVGNAWEWC